MKHLRNAGALILACSTLQFVGDDGGLRDGSNTEAGLNILGGIDRGLASGSRFFIGTKLGLIDAPDMKFTVGWTFSHGAARPAIKE